MFNTSSSLEAWQAMETDAIGSRLIELHQNQIQGDFDCAHLQAIHAYLTQDFPQYSGGFIRSNTGEHLRQRAITQSDIQYVVQYKDGGVTKDDIDDVLLDSEYSSIGFQPLNEDDAAERLASLYSKLDYLHPFDDVNSRTIREFVRQYAAHMGLSVEWTNINAHHAQILQAREALYLARDAEVMRLHYPESISIDSLKEGGSSRYVAFETMKKLAACKKFELADIFKWITAKNEPFALEKINTPQYS